MTNIQLNLKRKREMNRPELYKLLGIIMLITQFEFTTRASLWIRAPNSKYIPAPNLGVTTGMSNPQFDELWRALRWSEQTKERPYGMPHAENWWMLIDNMVELFNQYREESFLPSEWICVDESISRWYGIGGGWISIGITMYISIDSKPENGCKIQSSACGKSGVILCLLIVKSTEDSDLHTLENDEGIAHETSIFKYICLPWDNTRCGVCADSYFASVLSAEELTKIGLRFIGVFKTATKKTDGIPIKC